MATRFGRNAASNFIAGLLPALVGLATVPFIVHGLGKESYGLFTLITSIVGYFALIDINVTAGSTKHIAHHHALGESRQVSEVFSFGLLIYLLIGALGAVPIYLLADWLPRSAFKVPQELQPVASECLRVAAFGFLFGQLQAYLQSVPQALLRYDRSARLEAMFGVLVPLSSVAVILAGRGLYEVVLVRVVLSLVNCLLLFGTIRDLLPELRLHAPARQTAREVSSFSAYSFLSRVAFLSYSHADKLIIGALVGMGPLAYYAVAATLGNRVLGMMYRISAVMFPAASALAAKGSEAELQGLYLRLCRYVSFANAAALLLIAGFAEPLLYFWMGPGFAAEGALILRLVACAQFVDSLTNIPSLVNDGLGHPKVSGLFAITRAVVGLGSVYLLVLWFGISGAAWAHLFSAVLLTLAFLVFVHGRTVPCSLLTLWRQSYRPALLTLVLGAGAAAMLARLAGLQPVNLLLSVGLLIIALLLTALRWLLLAEDKARVMALMKPHRQGRG